MASKKLNVLMVAAECAPLAKVGGLADVVGSLPKAMDKMNVAICLPRYQQLLSSPARSVGTLTVPGVGPRGNTKIFQARLPGSHNVQVFLFENKTFFSQGAIYGAHRHSSDVNQLRYGFFCLTVAEFIKKFSRKTNVVHCHDWHTGLIPFLLSGDHAFAGLKTMFTIHNIANQGIWPVTEAKKIFTGYQFPTEKNINFMEYGITYADLVTTVSPSYAKEILTKKYGYNLAPLLKKRSRYLKGVLNGLDLTLFDPATDGHLYRNYSLTSLGGKQNNKTRLQKDSGLVRAENQPLLGVVSRLYEQKGLDWLAEITPTLVENGSQLFILGTGEKQLERKFKALAKKYPRQVKALIKFDAGLAQKIYAACDIFLVPSRFEPCGLTQMIAMRYGTVPVVRKTGGLKDTVTPYRKTAGRVQGNGFVFEKEKPEALLQAVNKAVRTYQRPRDWHQLRLNCMRTDFSWDRSAAEYLRLYRNMLQ